MILPDISLSSWAGLLAAGALIGTCWRTIKVVLTHCADLVVCRVVLKEETARAVWSYTWKNGKRSPFGLRMFGGITSFVAPKRRVEVVAYEAVTSDPVLFWFGRVPTLVKVGFHGKGDDVNVGFQSGGRDSMPGMLWFIRGTIDVDTFIETAVHEYNQLRQATESVTSSVVRPKRFNIVRMTGAAREAGNYAANKISDYATPSSNNSPEDTIKALQRNEMRLVTWASEDLIDRPKQDVKPFESHPISTDLLKQFDEIGIWLRHEQWFRSKQIPWRRGVLLYGPAGTGKSTIVRNVALQYDLPVYTFDLSTFDNRDFPTEWQRVMQNAPAIALLEDFDATFNGRTNIAVQGKQREGLTFDCLLNTISGVGSSDGVLLFVTTNKVDSLDEALGVPRNGDSKSTRPGRIDRAIYVGPMGEPERRALAKHILGDFPDLIEETVGAGDGETAAQFQDRCSQLGMKMFWAKGVDSSKVEEPAVRAPIKSRMQVLETRIKNAALLTSSE